MKNAKFSGVFTKINNNYTNQKLNDSLLTKGALFHSLSTDCLHHKNKEFNSILYKKIYETFEMTLNYGINFKSLIENKYSLNKTKKIKK